METTEIVIAAVSCTAFWEFAKYIIGIIAAKMGKGFSSEASLKGIESKLQTLEANQDMMQKSLSKLSASVAEDQAITARVRILSFADDMMAGRDHSKDAFDQVLCDIDRYDHYCSEHPHFKNNQTAMSRELILDQYKECERNRTFLSYKPKEK